jgi:hypothetical protein
MAERASMLPTSKARMYCRPFRLLSLRALTMRAFFLLCLLTSAVYAGDLQDLVSASNDFEVQMIEH